MFEAYKIGIKLSLIDHVSRGLVSMSRGFMKSEADAARLESRILSIQKTALKSGAMLGVGVGMFAMLEGPYKEAKKLAQAQADFSTMNLSAADNAAAFAQAATLSHKVLGSTITQNVKNIQDLHTAFGDLHHALETSELFTKMSIVGRVANGGKDVDGLIMSAAKALEHRGGKVVNSTPEFESEANMMTQVMLGTKMRVSPRDYLTASGTGKMAYQLFDKEYLYGVFAGLMSFMGGNKAGTSAMTAFSSLIGGHMDSKGKGFLSEIGLWTEGVSPKRLKMMREATKGLSKEEMKEFGFLMPTTGGLSDVNSELYAHRPDIFISTVLVPAIKRRFGMDLSDDQLALLVAKNFNRATGDFIGNQITMAPKLNKDAGIFRKTATIGEGLASYMKSPAGAEIAASAAWENFLAMLGTVYLPAITSGMLKLAGVLDSFSGFVERNPTLVKGLVGVFAAIAGLAVVGGTLGLISAAFSGIGVAMTFFGGGVVMTTIAAAFTTIGAVIGPVVVGIGALAALFYGLSKIPAVGRPESHNSLEDFYAGRGNQSSRYYGLNSKGGAGRGFVNPDFVRPAASDAESTRPVQLVLRDGGRVLADVVSSQQARGVMNNASAGGYELGLHQPGMNLRTN